MASEIYAFDESLFLNSSPEMVLFEEFYTNFDEELHFLDRFITGLSPSHQIENLSPIESTQFPSASNGSNWSDGYGDSSGFEVKTEDFCAGENVAKMVRRSYSSNCFDQENCDFSFRNRIETVSGSLGFQDRAMSVVGRYSAEERKQRICKYRAKRNQRNFNKKIKYACRKKLADNRPRVRGRFARSDETVEAPNGSYGELPLDGFLEEEDDLGAMVGLGGGTFINHYGFTHFYGY